MRTILIFVFSFFLTNSFAQIVIDPIVKRHYENAYKKLPLKQRKKLEELQDDLLKSNNASSDEYKKLFPYSPLNFAVVTLHSIDTLNKNQLTPGSYLYHAKKYPILFCEASLMSDSLGIVLYPGVAQNSSIDITHLCVHDRVQTEYHEWVKYDTSFRTNLQEEKTDALTLPFTTIKFVLSDTNFVVGKTIYGYADIVSDPYYQDEWSFKSGYIKRRLHFRYYFKFVVTKNGT